MLGWSPSPGIELSWLAVTEACTSAGHQLASRPGLPTAVSYVANSTYRLVIGREILPTRGSTCRPLISC